MEKKEYRKPCARVVEMTTGRMICGSFFTSVYSEDQVEGLESEIQQY